jgi:hypothetical protein
LTKPAEGERSAIVGYAGQYGLAARVVRPVLTTLEWIRVADPSAGVADDFQFLAGAVRHALQVKWSQYASSFAWSDLVNAYNSKSQKSPALLTELVEAWKRVRSNWDGPLLLHLCTNGYASTAPPSTGTPLASSTAEGPRHFSAFVQRAFVPIRERILLGVAEWTALAELPEVSEWADAWAAWKTAAGLLDDEFVRFLRDFTIWFGASKEESDPINGLGPPDQDLDKIAGTLQALVADPARPVELTRDEFLARLGWLDRVSYRHPHKFPVPAVYAANDAARLELEASLSGLPGGYLALVGPAGSGKSTLLESVKLPGRAIRYYAFVPDAPDPLSGRGEADSFLHDLTLALEAAGLHRDGVGNDPRAQQVILSRQLERAGEEWKTDRRPTVVVVDGLDHIPREQNPSRSLLEELPSPLALPGGVFFILGTQTTSILPQQIQTVLAGTGRTIAVPPLPPDQIKLLVDQAGVGDWLLPSQIDAFAAATEGHPLAATYLLNELADLERREPDLPGRRDLADHVIAEDASRGEIQQRYVGYLRAVGGDPAVRDLPAAVARLRVPIDLDWLSTWASPEVVTEFAERTAPFFRRDGRRWRFVHNSFRRTTALRWKQVSGRPDVDSLRTARQDRMAPGEVGAASPNPFYLCLASHFEVAMSVHGPGSDDVPHETSSDSLLGN